MRGSKSSRLRGPATKAAEEAAALEAFYKTPEGILAKEEAEFEAELAAEAEEAAKKQN
jgi:hypothetical protein